MNWLELTRKNAEKKYEGLSFPAAKDENFRFTPLSLEELEPLLSSSSLHADASLDEGEDALLVLNGKKADFLGAADGIHFSDLLAAVDGKNSLIQSELKNEIFSEDKFAQMASSKWTNGAFVHVSNGVKANVIRVLQNSVAAQELFRNIIVLEENASATLVQEISGDDAVRFVNELTSVRLASGSHLHWVIVQRNGKGTTGISRHWAHLAENAQLEITVIHLGAKKIQVRQEINLQGTKSKLGVSGAVRGNADQHFDLWTEVKHHAEKTVSGMDYFYVMDNKSRAVFNGLIHIDKNSTDCEAYQKAKSLLLSNKATVHAIPKLIIQTDAVKCSHGASVSSVSPEQIHYLQSRGIPKSEAERMIIRGFTEPVLVRLPTESLYARVEDFLPKEEMLQ